MKLKNEVPLKPKKNDNCSNFSVDRSNLADYICTQPIPPMINKLTGNPMTIKDGHWVEIGKDVEIDHGPSAIDLLVSNMSFVKHDQDKPRMDLIFWPAIEDLAKVLTHGARKYSDNNWHKCTSVMRYFGAAMRHMIAFWRGEDNDPESGLPHLSHAMCCIMFIQGIFSLHGSSADDRIMKKGTEKGNIS